MVTKLIKISVKSFLKNVKRGRGEHPQEILRSSVCRIQINVGLPTGNLEEVDTIQKKHKKKQMSMLSIVGKTQINVNPGSLGDFKLQNKEKNLKIIAPNIQIDVNLRGEAIQVVGKITRPILIITISLAIRRQNAQELPDVVGMDLPVNVRDRQGPDHIALRLIHNHLIPSLCPNHHPENQYHHHHPLILEGISRLPEKYTESML